MLIVIVPFVLLVGCLFILQREKKKQEQKQSFDSGWDEPEYVPKNEEEYINTIQKGKDFMMNNNGNLPKIAKIASGVITEKDCRTGSHHGRIQQTESPAGFRSQQVQK